MPLIECPDCKKQISDQSQACIHCGCPIQPSDIQKEKDFSDLKRYRANLIDSNNKIHYKTVWAKDSISAKNKIFKDFKGLTIDDKYGIQESSVERGRFNCPSCKSKYTFCKRNIGCAVMIIIFVSFGLGLIMIPFLPQHCECHVCGYKWKS